VRGAASVSPHFSLREPSGDPNYCAPVSSAETRPNDRNEEKMGSALGRLGSAAVVVFLCSSLAVDVAAGPANTVPCGSWQDCATCSRDRRCGWCTFLGSVSTATKEILT
jgi:hypothetical protein